MPQKKPARPSKPSAPAVPAWLKASWKTADQKPLKDFTARDIDAVISEVRAEKNREAYKPVKLSITLKKSQAEWLKRAAAKWHCSIEELIDKAVWIYRQDPAGLKEDLEYFTQKLRDQTKYTKAISEGTEKIRTGRYEP